MSAKEETIRNISLEERKEFKLPAGAELISKECTINAEKIKNGYLLRKNYSIKYKLRDSDHTEYEYYTEVWYTKDNPINYKEPKETSLADKL